MEQHFLFHASHLALQHDFSVRLWINYYIYIYIDIHTHNDLTSRRHDAHDGEWKGKYPKMAQHRILF